MPLLPVRDIIPADSKGKAAWRQEARVAAVLGSCPRTLKSTRSGLNHWIDFIELTYGVAEVAGKILPPALGDVLAWSHTFRCVGPVQFCAPHVYCVACQVLRDIFELPGTSAHDLLCSGLRGASNRASLSQEGYDRHRQATNVPAEGTEAYSKVCALSH